MKTGLKSGQRWCPNGCGKSVAFILDAMPQRNRAIRVMTAYAVKNYGYENKE